MGRSRSSSKKLKSPNSEAGAEGPDKLWEGNPEALIPHEQVKAALADWIAEKYRAEWDGYSPDYGSEFFLKRDAGLKAYATYEADYYLRAPGRHSAVESKRKCPEKWRARLLQAVHQPPLCRAARRASKPAHRSAPP